MCSAPPTARWQKMIKCGTQINARDSSSCGVLSVRLLYSCSPSIMICNINVSPKKATICTMSFRAKLNALNAIWSTKNMPAVAAGIKCNNRVKRLIPIIDCSPICTNASSRMVFDNHSNKGNGGDVWYSPQLTLIQTVNAEIKNTGDCNRRLVAAVFQRSARQLIVIVSEAINNHI